MNSIFVFYMSYSLFDVRRTQYVGRKVCHLSYGVLVLSDSMETYAG